MNKTNHVLMLGVSARYMQGIPDKFWTEEDFEIHEFLRFVIEALESGENLYIESDPKEVALSKFIKSELRKMKNKEKS